MEPARKFIFKLILYMANISREENHKKYTTKAKL